MFPTLTLMLYVTLGHLFRYTTVRVKVTDPAYSAWFMKFSDAVIANHSAAHVPVCDTNYNPPRCSNLYHDQEQTPGYPRGDGVCDPPGCDVGSVPVGEYLFDPRAANVSVKGPSFTNHTIAPLFQNSAKSGFEMVFSPSTFGAVGKPRLEFSIFKEV